MLVEAALVAAIGAGLFYAFRSTRKSVPAQVRPPSRREPQSSSLLRRGDVLLYLSEEAWLAQRLSLHEEGPLLDLFSCPGSSLTDWVGVLRRGADAIWLLSEVPVPEGPLSSTLTHAGWTYQAELRANATVVPDGTDLPRLGDKIAVHIYRAVPDRVAVMLDGDRGRLALVGRTVPRGLVEVLPGGPDTRTSG